MISHVSSPNVYSLVPIAPIARLLSANSDAGDRRDLASRRQQQPVRQPASPLAASGPVGAFVDVLA